MKKYVMIVKTEEYSGIELLVNNNFNEDWDSPILKGVLRDFPLESRRSIIKNEEIEMINEGSSIKIEPENYLNRDGKVLTSKPVKVKNLSV
mgnify:CR=1 FL=1